MNDNNPHFLAEQLAKSEEISYVDRLEKLNDNYYVFDKNYQDLIRILNTEIHEEEMIELWDLKNRKLLKLSIREVLRLFHNFIASAQSLVEQTQVWVKKWYSKTDFFKEFEEQINIQFNNNPLAGFIKELRNYNLHYSLPVSQATFTIDPQNKTISFSYVLLKSALLKSNFFKNLEVKKILVAFSDEIDIFSLVKDFHKLEFDFQTWLFTRLKEIHSKELIIYYDQSQSIINSLDDEEKEARGYL